MADDTVPGWITEVVEAEAEVLTGLVGLPRVPFITLVHLGPTEIEGQRIIQAEASADTILIEFSGSWSKNTPAARQQVIGNLAHELAHVWQYSLGAPTEGRMLHEGFAEAIGIDVLRRCGASCGTDSAALLETQRRACAAALREGVLLLQETPEAVYGCGTILTAHASTKAGLTPQELYLQFAGTEDRSEEDFLKVASDAAGSAFANSAFTFLYSDLRLSQPRRVMERLREGKL